MKTSMIYILLISLISTWVVSDSARILFLTPVGSKSHKIFFMGISRALAARGHHITMLSAFKSSIEIKNIKEVAIPEADITQMMTDVFQEGKAEKNVRDMMMDMPRICNDALALKKVQDLKKEKFDLVILSVCFDYCFLSLVHHFQVPFIYSSPAGLFGPFAEIVGSVEFPSLVPNKFMDAVFPQTFKQRFMSTVLGTLFSIMNTYYFERSMEKICKERGLCPPDMPSVAEMNRNVSLTIINSVKTLEWPPRPIMPNVIYAGGAHIRPAKNLSQELENWISTSGNDGFIFFSLGSAVTPSFMPEKFRKIFINVFGSLKQQVLWKWDEETMPDLPKNVKLGKWLPQQDILAHSKLKLFITHGGLLSTLESTYHGVPIIGMPILADQFGNMKEAANEGWAKLVPWNKLTEDFLRDTIIETLADNSLREVSLRRSSLMRDRPMEPADEAAFWVEYVLRHKGARHLMSPIGGMSWCELYNMDIWAIIVGLTLSLLYITLRMVKTLLCFCFKSKNKIKKKRE